MALALFSSGNPVVDAIYAPGLTPDGMTADAQWHTARAFELKGCRGVAAQPASVRTLWNDEWFFFEVSCSDDRVVSPGAEDGLDHYLLGDTVEIFLARRSAADYAEIHATPAGRKTVYFFAGYRQPSALPPSAAEVRVASSALSSGWRAFVAVPRALIADGASDRNYDVFFARYDYSARDAEPVLSSFPAQEKGKPDFHRRADYAVLRLKK